MVHLIQCNKCHHIWPTGLPTDQEIWQPGWGWAGGGRGGGVANNTDILLPAPCQIPKPQALCSWSRLGWATLPTSGSMPGHAPFPPCGTRLGFHHAPFPCLSLSPAGVTHISLLSMGQVKLLSPAGLCWDWPTFFLLPCSWRVPTGSSL